MWHNELAAADSLLDRLQARQDRDLFILTQYRLDVQSLQFGVHSVESTHEVFEEELKGLRQAYQDTTTFHVEGG